MKVQLTKERKIPMKRINRITSIVSASIFALFSLYAGNAFFKTGYRECQDVVLLDDHSVQYDIVFTGITPESLPFFGAILFLAVALTLVIFRAIYPHRRSLSYISFALNTLSTLLFLTLETELAQYMFVRYTLWIDYPIALLVMDIIRYGLISLVLFAEATHLTVSIADQLQEHQKNKQMEKGVLERILYDDQIVAINRSKAENHSDSIVYKDKNGGGSIDLHTCAINYQQEHKTDHIRCIGERHAEKGYFLLYTSGIKTKILFKKSIVFGNHFLHGTRRRRFLQLQKMILETKYTTYDLS